MKILAIDTSNYTLGIALVDDDKIIGEYITNIKKNHSVRVMPAIEMLLKDCDTLPQDIEKIVVAEGPGSYTGVRIGVTIAKTLAWTLNIPLSGVSSLAVLAASAGSYFNGIISPLFDARRGQIYTGLYQFQESRLLDLASDHLTLTVNWTQRLLNREEPVLFVGNDLSIHKEQIKADLGDRAYFARVTEQNPRPSELAILGRDKEAVDIHNFVPNYIRLAEAEAKWIEATKGSKLQ